MAKFKVFDQKGRIWVYDTSSEKFENLDLYNHLTNNLGDFIPFDYSRTKEQIEAAKNPQGVPGPIEDEEDRDDDDREDEDEDEEDEDNEDEDEDEDNEEDEEDNPEEDETKDEAEKQEGENTEGESPGETAGETPGEAGADVAPEAMGDAAGADAAGMAGGGAGGAAAGGGTAAAGTAAGGTAVAEGGTVVAAATSEFWVPVLIVIAVVIVVIILIVVIFVIVFMVGDNEQAAADTATQTTICLDPGHPSEVGSGAPGEVKNNYVIATELKTLLISKGYNVVLTKNSESESVTNAKRAEICSAAGASLMYRIHQDANTEPQRTFHIVPGPSLDKIHSSSLSYGKTIHETMIKELGSLVKGGGKLLTDGKYLQEGTSEYNKILAGSKKANELNLPAVLIEALALTTEGQAWLDNASNRAALVKAIAAGIEKALPPGSGGTGPAGIVSKAKFYESNNAQYRKEMMKPQGSYCHSEDLADSDCGGFTTTTVVKSGADPEFEKYGKSHRACQFVNYFQNNPKWETVYTPVNQDSSKLKPGDILVVSKMDSSGGCVKGWSHTGIYVGADGSGKGNKIEASLCDHGPEYGNWYSKFNYAFRKK